MSRKIPETLDGVENEIRVFLFFFFFFLSEREIFLFWKRENKRRKGILEAENIGFFTATHYTEYSQTQSKLDLAKVT